MTVRTIVLSKLLKIYSPELQPQPSTCISLNIPSGGFFENLDRALTLTKPSRSHLGLLPKPASAFPR